MKINKRVEEMKERIREAKRVRRKVYKLHKYKDGGTKKNETIRKNDRKEVIQSNNCRRCSI